jgi:hypothetical protein
MRLFYFLLVFLLTACGGGQDPNPNPLYNLENLSIKLTIEPQNNILFEHSLPHRNYENQTEEVPHFVVKSNEDISVLGAFYDESGNLSEEELLEITQSSHFECRGDRVNRNANTFDFQISSEKLKYINIDCSMNKNYCPKEECEFLERINTEESFLYPGSTEISFKILPENPLNEVIPMLNEMGYSPYKNYDRDGPHEIHYDVNFDKKRDKFDLGFINVNQEGPYFFWDENGITNIVFSIREHKGDRPNTNDSEMDVEKISAYVSKLTDIDPEHFQKTIICNFWRPSPKEEGSDMYDICESDGYSRYTINLDNLSNKFKLSYTYDNSFNMYDVSISLK